MTVDDSESWRREGEEWTEEGNPDIFQKQYQWGSGPTKFGEMVSDKVSGSPLGEKRGNQGWTNSKGTGQGKFLDIRG